MCALRLLNSRRGMRLIDLVLNAKINIILYSNGSSNNNSADNETKSNEKVKKGRSCRVVCVVRSLKKEGKEQSKQVKMKTRLKCLTYKLICAGM